MKLKKVVKNILGPSPLLYGVKKINTKLFFRGGNKNDPYLSDDSFFELITETIDSDTNQNKLRRLTNTEINQLLSNKAKLTKEQRLLKSVLQECNLSKAIFDQGFQNIHEMYEFRRKYKHYLRIKRFIPLSIVGPFAGCELSKMAYAAALGSKSISLTLPGLIGYSLPAFYFFHMSSFYVPDKLKPMCQVLKYTLGAPFWVVGYLTDDIMSNPEELFFGEAVPIDIVGTGGTIPGDIGDISKVLSDMKDFANEIANIMEK